jgi:predicted DNA-binding transcriptional regulator YafY
MPVVKQARLREKYLDQLLRNRNRKYTVVQMTEELSRRLGTDISKETVYKDLRHIKDEYEAVIETNSYKQLYYEDPEFTIEKTPLTEEDKNLLDMASTLFRVFKSSSILPKFESTINKILTGSSISKAERNNMDCFQPEQTTGALGTDLIEPILNSILEKEPIEIVYQKDGFEPETKIISAYVLKQVKAHWYLVGFDHLKTNQIKNYSLDRIISIKKSNEPYVLNEGFNSLNYFRYSFGIFQNHSEKPLKIKLEFTGKIITQIVNYPLSPYQTHKFSKDGKKLIINLELFYSDEITSEILRYGANVKVLAPISLANTIKKMAVQVSKLYT